MKQKETWFLLTPCAFFIAAGLFFAVYFGPAMAPNQASQEKFVKIAERARHGEISSDVLIQRWRDAVLSQDRFTATMFASLRVIGLCMLVGAAAQIYVVLRVTSGKRAG